MKYTDKMQGLKLKSSQQLRLIPIEKRPRKLNLNQKEATGTSSTALIPDGNYLFPMVLSRKTVMQPVTLLKNLSSTPNFGN